MSLKNLAAVTLQQTNADKSASVPKLFAKGQLKQLIAYCKRDVALTRDIFKYGVRHGCVHNASDNHLRVWWAELAAYLANHPAQQGASVLGADHFAWQLDRIKAQVAREVDPRLGLEPRQIPSIARIIIAAYNPFGVHMTAQERRDSVDEDGEPFAFS